MCLGLYLPGVKPVYIKQEKLGRESVAHAKKLHFLTLLLTNIQTLRIGELDADLYFLDEKVKFVSLDTLIDGTEVLATCTNQAKPAKEPAKEAVKRKLRRGI